MEGILGALRAENSHKVCWSSHNSSTGLKQFQAPCQEVRGAERRVRGLTMCGRLCSRQASKTLRSEITWLFMRVDSTPSIRWLLRCQTVARTRSENDVVPMDVSVIKGKGGKGKDGKGKEGKSKEGKGKTKAKGGQRTSLIPSRILTSSRSSFTVTKLVMSELTARRRNVDDEERKNMTPQNGLSASSVSPSPPGLTNATTSTSGASSSSLRQLTFSFVCPRRKNFTVRCGSFALRYNSNVDRVMVDSGAAHSACPSDYANEHEVREVQRKIQFQTASGETPGASW